MGSHVGGCFYDFTGAYLSPVQYYAGSPPGNLFLSSAYVPEATSFDKRKELKRVLRGHHLKEDHPEKPKGYFGNIMAKASASVSAETAVLTGARVQLTPYQGALIVVEMKVPRNYNKYYWIGIAGEWRYLFSRPLNEGDME